MSYLDAKDLSRAMLVSFDWYQISSYPLLWKRLYLKVWTVVEDLMLDFEDRLRQLETRIQSRNPLQTCSDLSVSANDFLSIQTHDEESQSFSQDHISIYDQFFNSLIIFLDAAKAVLVSMIFVRSSALSLVPKSASLSIILQHSS